MSADGLNGDDKCHHNVYVVELHERVLKVRQFRRANPNYIAGKGCLYVGCSGLNPAERFRNHLDGYKANRFVQRYGLRLLPDFYECFNPMPYFAACRMEVELAEELREKGYAVWQA